MLVSEIMNRFWEEQISPAIAIRSGLEAVRAMADAYIREITLGEEHVRTLYVLMGEALGPVPEIRPVFAELDRGFRSAFARLIENGIEDGNIDPDVEPEEEAAALMSMLRGTTMQWLIDPGCFDLERMREFVGKWLERRLAR